MLRDYFCSLDFKKTFENNSWKDILNLKNFGLKKIPTNFHILKFLYTLDCKLYGPQSFYHIFS